MKKYLIAFTILFASCNSGKDRLNDVLKNRETKSIAIKKVLSGNYDANDFETATETYTIMIYFSDDKLIQSRNKMEYDFNMQFFMPMILNKDTAGVINALAIYQKMFESTTNFYKTSIK